MRPAPSRHRNDGRRTRRKQEPPGKYRRRHRGSPFTLAIDIGGSNIKASVLDRRGHMIVPALRLPTPPRPAPDSLIRAIMALARRLPPYDRVSVGFPGYVRNGCIHTAPNLGTEKWHGFALTDVLTKRLGKPTRVLNDADMQGFGVVKGRGIECVLTLGTGIGSALFKDGHLLPHLELGQHPIWRDKTYDQYLGDGVLKRKGAELWNRRLRQMLPIVQTLINYDTLYLGGGNAMLIDFKLPKNVKISANTGGITGGIKLWEKAHDDLFKKPAQKR